MAGTSMFGLLTQSSSLVGMRWHTGLGLPRKSCETGSYLMMVIDLPEECKRLYNWTIH